MWDVKVLAALGAIGLWSTNAYVAAVALERLSVGWLLLVQYTVAAMVFLAVRWARGSPARAQRGRAQRGRVGRAGLVVGIVGLTGTIFLQYVAFALAPIVAANVLAYGWPLLAALAVFAVRRDIRAGAGAVLALLGFAGVGLIFVGPAQEAATATAISPVWGYAAALGSAACMTVYTLGCDRLDVPVADLLVPATAFGALAAVVLIAISQAPLPPLAGVAVAAYLGLGPMAGGYGLWTLAMSDGGSSRLAPLGYATPLLSTVLLLVTGAPASTSTLAGIALVLACSVGVLLVDRYLAPAQPSADRTRTASPPPG